MEIKQDISAYISEDCYNLDNDIMLRYYPERIREILLSASYKLDEMNCLELGLGHGYSTNALEMYFKEYTVLDGDTRIIEQYVENYPQSKTKIIETYFEDFHSEEKYDVIVMGFVLEHVESPEYVLKKYKSYLKENGKMFIAVPNADALNRRVGLAVGLLNDTTELSEHDIKLGHRRYYTLDTIRKECNSVGLEIEKVEGLFLKAMSTKQMMQLNLSKDILKAYCYVGKDYPELCLGILLEVKRGENT